MGENLNDKYYDHPRASVVVSSGDGRLRHDVPGELAVRYRSRRDDAERRRKRPQAGTKPSGIMKIFRGAGADAACTSRSRHGSSTRGVRNAWWPTSRPIADPFTGVAIYDSFIVSYITKGGWEVEGRNECCRTDRRKHLRAWQHRGSPLDAASHAYSHAQLAQRHRQRQQRRMRRRFISTSAMPESDTTVPPETARPTASAHSAAHRSRSSQTIERTGPRRHVLEIPIGSRAVRACTIAQPKQLCPAMPSIIVHSAASGDFSSASGRVSGENEDRDPRPMRGKP